MRRFRLLLAAAVVVLGALAFFSSPANAAGEEGTAVEEVIHEAEENGATHSDAECIEILAEGGTIEDCQAAPNPLLPEKNEIIWGAFGFIIVFGFLAKFGYPAIKKTMEERTEKIRSEINDAETAKADAEALKADYAAKLAEAKAEAGRVIEEARTAADALKRERASQLEAELTELRQRAAADVEAAKAQALADLRAELTDLAIRAAEQVVERNLDPETNRALVEGFITQVGANR